MGTGVIRICWCLGGGGTIRGGTDGLHQMALTWMPTAKVSLQGSLKQDNQCCSLQLPRPSLLWLIPGLAAFAGCSRAAGLNSTVQLHQKSECEEPVESSTLAKFELNFLFHMFRMLLITFNLFLICIINPHYNSLTSLRILGQCLSVWLMKPLQ